MGTPEVEMEVTRMGLGISGKGAPREGHHFLFTGHVKAHVFHSGTPPEWCLLHTPNYTLGHSVQSYKIPHSSIYCDFDE